MIYCKNCNTLSRVCWSQAVKTETQIGILEFNLNGEQVDKNLRTINISDYSTIKHSCYACDGEVTVYELSANQTIAKEILDYAHHIDLSAITTERAIWLWERINTLPIIHDKT